MSEQTGTTWELCPECETEVELTNELKVQTCPTCGRQIFPCSICDTRFCIKCPLDQEAER